MRRSAVSSARFLWEGILDLVYPPVCLLCERWDAPPICDDCYAAFTAIPEPICEICGRPQTPALPCRSCEREQAAGGWGFDAARAAGIYYGPLREGIHLLKYRQEEMLGPLLGAHLANRCVAEDLLPPAWRQRLDAVIPVPLHPRKLRQRGYNQTALLARPLAEMLQAPLQDALVLRARYAKPQVGLSAETRRKLARDTFQVTDNSLVLGKHLLIVDDVFTTGTTVSVCAGVLKAAGAASVIAVTLAAGD